MAIAGCLSRSLIVEGDWSAESGRQAAIDLLYRHPTLDAIFASNDQMALGVMFAAHKLGRRIPEDLSIVGVDNIPEAARFWPSLTSIRQRLRKAGGRAVRALDALIGGPDRGSHDISAQTTLLQPELIVRASSR